MSTGEQLLRELRPASGRRPGLRRFPPEHLSPNSQARTLAAAKSLLAFGHRVGYLPLNVGAAIRLPAKKTR